MNAKRLHILALRLAKYREAMLFWDSFLRKYKDELTRNDFDRAVHFLSTSSADYLQARLSLRDP